MNIAKIRKKYYLLALILIALLIGLGIIGIQLPIQKNSDFKEITESFFYILSCIAFGLGGFWALYQFDLFRESKNIIQFELDANLFKLSYPRYEVIKNTLVNNEENNYSLLFIPKTKLTHAVEILLKLTNKGKTRFKLYNLQLKIKTMPEYNIVTIDNDDGHLKLKTIFQSGNIVPKMQVKSKPVEITSFYYIEPDVEQTIHYLALITEPQELLQIIGKFSLEQKRIVLHKDKQNKQDKDKQNKQLFPHTVARTYQIRDDCLIKD